ncbi:MAG TPA: hypothetical protein DGT23_28700 [Micromonosporaceae bacterium]|nr:hypothetical protein [Micromonosporaceae bacterium]
MRLLGPVEFWDGDAWLPVKSAKQRALLAVLALSPGQSVKRDALLEILWEGKPPKSAEQLLHHYVWRLRQLLCRGPGQVQTAPGGYLLAVLAEDLEHERFAALLAQGREAERRGNIDRAIACIATGLALWRGPALADVRSVSFLNDAAQRLDQRRIEAQESLADLLIEHGRTAEAMATLEAVTAADPFRERAWRLLLLALHQQGRRADALAAYQRLWRVWKEELGIEPSRSLAGLHRLILADDPSLDTAPAPDAILTPPRQLPATIRHLVGRAAELRRLSALADAAVASGGVIAAIDGTAGVGKTTLAVHWAHRVASRFPDGQLYVDLRGFHPDGTPTEPSSAVRSFLSALNVAPQRVPADLDAQAALYRSRLAGQRMLVVLDNASDAEQVRPLLPGSSGCLVVVTSRNQLTGLCASEGAHSLTLGLLSTVESQKLLAARLGADRVNSDPAAVDEIIDLCARLPLALAIAAARAVKRPAMPLADIAADMRDTPGRLDPFHTADPGTDIRAVFSWSQRQLSPAAARMFRLLGLHPGPDISLAAASSLIGKPLNDTRLVLIELCEAHLITEHTHGRFTVHDLLRAHAAEQVHRIEPGDQLRAAKHRLIDHYLHNAYAADRLMNPHRDPIALSSAQPGTVLHNFASDFDALEWLTTEHHCLLTAIEHAALTGWATQTWQLGWVFAHYLYRRGYWLDHVTTGRAAAAAAQRIGNTEAQALTSVNLARAHLQLCDFDPAQDQLLNAINLTEKAGDKALQAEAHHILSWVHDLKGCHTEALTHAQHGLTLFQAADHLTGQARALNTIGWLHAQQGNHHQALTFCEPALQLHQKLGNAEGQAATWHSIGYAHHHLGNHQLALTCYQHALTLFRELQNRYFEGNTLASIGDTHHAIGNHTAADTAWRLALTILEDLNHPNAEDIRAKLKPHAPMSLAEQLRGGSAYLNQLNNSPSGT